jgi:hypothetical protein
MSIQRTRPGHVITVTHAQRTTRPARSVQFPRGGAQDACHGSMLFA